MRYGEGPVRLLTKDRDTVSQKNYALGCQCVIQPFELRDQVRHGNRCLIPHCDQAVTLEAIDPAVYLLPPCIHDRTDKSPDKSEIERDPCKGRYLDDRFSEREPESLRGSRPDPKTCKRSRTGRDCDRVDRFPVKFDHTGDLIKHRQKRLAVRLFIINSVFGKQGSVRYDRDGCDETRAVES